MFQTHLHQQRLGSFGAVMGICLDGQHRHLHVLYGAQRGQKIEGLEDESDLSGAIVVEVDR